MLLHIGDQIEIRTSLRLTPNFHPSSDCLTQWLQEGISEQSLQDVWHPLICQCPGQNLSDEGVCEEWVLLSSLKISRGFHAMDSTSWVPVSNTAKEPYGFLTEDLVKHINHVCIPSCVFKGCEKCTWSHDGVKGMAERQHQRKSCKEQQKVTETTRFLVLHSCTEST